MANEVSTFPSVFHSSFTSSALLLRAPLMAIGGLAPLFLAVRVLNEVISLGS